MNKLEKQRLLFISVLVFFICLSFCLIINKIRVDKIEYEYYKDGHFGTSKECYINDRDICMCKINNNFVNVDNYYQK